MQEKFKTKKVYEMRRKVKEALAEVLAGIVLVALFCTFVLCFIFVDQYFLTCIWVGILATIVFAALHWNREIVCG